MFDKETILELEKLSSEFIDKTPQLIRQILKDYNIFDIEGHHYSGTDFDVATGYRGYQICPKDFDIGYGFLFTITIDKNVRISYDGFYDDNHRHHQAEVFKHKVINKVIGLLETNETFNQRLIDCAQQQKASLDRNNQMKYLIQNFTEAIKNFKVECEVDKIFKNKHARLDDGDAVWVPKFGDGNTVVVNEFNFTRNPTGTFTITCMKDNDVITSASRSNERELSQIMYRFAERLIKN